MAFDAHKNLAIATVSAAPSPPTSGTSLSVASGEGARFPAAPFNATVWPASSLPNPVTADVVRVTAVAGDTLTIVRATENTAARSVVAGDLIAATITVKSLTDIESGINFPAITTGPISGTTGTFGGNVSIAGSITFTDPATNGGSIVRGTADGADNVRLFVCGGGAAAHDRGAYFWLAGNEAPDPGAMNLVAGDVAGGALKFYTGALQLRGTMHRAGGFTWGPGTAEPAAGGILVGAAVGAGNVFTQIVPGELRVGNAGSTAISTLIFFNGTGVVGSIQTNGSATSYNTTSDARLKQDLGVARVDQSGDVLRQTVIHDFTWKSDGTPGRGVFAQEAAPVAPFAVTVGTDETDDEGRLVNPWGVDYAKYVADLIVGWQHHDAQLAALTSANAALSARVATLEARLAALEAAVSKG